MKSRNAGRNIFRHSLVGILTVGTTLAVSISLVACAPAKKNKDEKASADPIAEAAKKNGTCEQRIRAQMEKKIPFRERAEFKDLIARANQTVQKPTAAQFFVRQIKEQTQAVSVEHTAKETGKIKGLSYELSVLREGTKDGMTFEMRYTEKEVNGSVDYREKYLVDSSCELKNETLSLEQLKKTDKGYKYEKRTVTQEGSGEHRDMELSIPAGGPFLNLMTAFDSMENATDGTYYFHPSTGMVKLKIEASEVAQFSKFGFEMAMNSRKITVVSDDRPMAVLMSREQNVLGVYVEEVLGNYQWRLPPAVWQNEALGKYAFSSASFDSKLPKNYLASSEIITLKAAKVPTYDHLAAYFNYSQPVKDTASGLFSLILKENPTARAALPTSPDELIANGTIQTELPEIQRVKEEILKTSPNDRSEQIAQILAYLEANYQFDQEMLKSNAMRPLTTAEALKRGKGVCQHYSVIYTAIARALKIPTRIVVGLRFDNNGGSGYHAWVESEITAGQWQVIEPQDKASLTQMKTRYYYPVSRALFLEDMNRTQLDYISQLTESKLIFSPAE